MVQQMCYGNQGKELQVNKGIWFCALAWIGVWMGGCSQNFSADEPETAMSKHGFKPMDGAVSNGVGDREQLGPLSAQAPEGWVAQKPSSSMRVAQYGLPGPAGEATLGIFYFGPGQGGGIDANIERWYGQFKGEDGSSPSEQARRWNKQVGDIEVTLVDISGIFSGGMGSVETQAGYRMLGAIASHRSGLVFFKLIGPSETVGRWEESFNRYLEGLEVDQEKI